MSGGRLVAPDPIRTPTADSSRFVPKVNDALARRSQTLLKARPCSAADELARRAGQRARITRLRRELLSQIFLDRERRDSPADEVLTRPPG